MSGCRLPSRAGVKRASGQKKKDKGKKLKGREERDDRLLSRVSRTPKSDACR